MTREDLTIGAVPRPSAPWEARTPGFAVRAMTVELCARRYASGLRAIVLTGSLARDEATWVRETGGSRLLGDAEFLLVFYPHAPLPPPSTLRALEEEIERALGRDRIRGRVQLVPVYPTYFTELEPHILAYELCVSGQAVWGDPHILSLIPSFIAADIPLEDAWRLLANRTIELLEVLYRFHDPPEIFAENLAYRTSKLYLDMATSLLLFAGSYAPSYRERELRLRGITVEREPPCGWPFDLKKFCRRVSDCTRGKLSGTMEPLTEGLLEEALGHTLLLWRWQLRLLTHREWSETNSPPMEEWIRMQPLASALRGWAFVLRACGWFRSWRQWLRWAKLAARASPRFWVYEAAYDFLEWTPQLLKLPAEASSVPLRCKEILERLPLRTTHPDEGSDRGMRLAEEIAWNYHKFLEPTRA